MTTTGGDTPSWPAGHPVAAVRQLARRLQEARHRVGLTQHDVAVALTVPDTTISAIENGRRTVTGLELRRLARLYQRSVAWLLGNELTAVAARLTDRDRAAVLAFARFLEHQQETR